MAPARAREALARDMPRRCHHRALLQLRRRRRAGGALGLGRPRRARSQRTGHRLARVGQSAARSRAAHRTDAPWRDRLCRLTSLFVTPSARHPAGLGRSQEGARNRMGRRCAIASGPTRPATAAVRPRYRRRACDTCVFAGAFRSWHGADASVGGAGAAACRPDDARFGGDLHRRWARTRGKPNACAAGVPGVQFTGALRTIGCRRRSRTRDIGVAPFDPSTARAAATWVLLVAAEDLRIHGRRAAGRRAGAAPPRAARRARIAKACCTIRRIRAASTAPFRIAGRSRACGRRLGAAARARVVRDFSWEAHCRAARRAPAGAGRLVSAPLRVAASSPTRFRPSAAAAAGARSSCRAASSRAATTSRSSRSTRAGRRGVFETSVRGTPRHRVLPAGQRTIPFVRNVQKNERLWSSLEAYPAHAAAATAAFDLVHGQHAMTTVPSINAAATRRACRRWPRSATTGRSATGRISSTTRRSRRSVRRARSA